MNNPEGVIKFKQTMIKKHGSEQAWKQHMRELGKKAGSTPTEKLKGFAAMPKQKRKEAASKGGKISKRK